MTSSCTNIAAHLPRMAALQPETVAIHIPQRKHGYRSVSFAELERESNRIAQALEKIGIGRGVRTALMVTPGFEFFALTFALFKVGAVPVMIDPGIGVKNLKTCLAEAQPQAFVGVPKAHLARLLFGWGKGSLKVLLSIGPKFFPGGYSLAALLRDSSLQDDYQLAPTAAGDTAAILFTSGSTGVPKGVVYTHANFLAQVDQLREIYQIKAGEIDLPTFPLFALFAPALGMSSVVPRMDFTRPGSVDPQEIIGPIQQFGITTMFGSPALINRVGRYADGKGIKLASLKRVISAGAPVPAPVLERFAQMLTTDVEIFTPYGATESLPVCSIGSDEILSDTSRLTAQGKGVCVGRPVPSIDLQIIAIHDKPIAHWTDQLLVEDGQIGEIAVRGPQVTRLYYNRPESTRLAKIDVADGTFYHRMGDLGYRDPQGRIWFCGRKAHRVVSADTTYFSIPCEAIFNTHPDVYRSALVAVETEAGVQPLICIELEQGTDKGRQNEILSELAALAAADHLTAAIKQILIHPAFPVDIRHNAKIFREKLAVWAQEQLS